MADEKQPSSQEIMSGDNSHNYQAQRDVNVHHHSVEEIAKKSSLVIPTNKQISQYDPKVRILLEEIKVHQRQGTVLCEAPSKKRMISLPSMFLIILIYIIALFGIFLWRII